MKNSAIVNAILMNANNNKPLKASETVGLCKDYRVKIEQLRLFMSDYARIAIDGKDFPEDVKNKFFAQYKALLAELKYNGERLKPVGADFESILAFVGNYRKDKETSKREFLPASAATFRNNFEKFIAHRIKGELSKSAEEIEAARKAKNRAKAEAKKAAKAKQSKAVV